MAEWGDPREFQGTLRAFLERRGWSRNEFAMRLGISQGVVNRWFKTDQTFVRPRPRSLEAVAQLIEVPHSELMRMCGYLAAEPARAARPPELDILMREFEVGWHAADDTRRQIGADIVRAVFNVHPPRRPNRRRPKSEDETPEEDTGISLLVMQR